MTADEDLPVFVVASGSSSGSLKHLHPKGKNRPRTAGNGLEKFLVAPVKLSGIWHGFFDDK
jgi:hypothetical protein